MTKDYKGIIVEESLLDNRILNDLEIIKVEISKEENPEDRWHLYTVKVSEEDINKLDKNIKPKWYMHFWKEKSVIVIFKDKRFNFSYDNKFEWAPIIDYGLSIGIPKEQLDFPID